MSRMQVLASSSAICMEDANGTVIEVSDKEDLVPVRPIGSHGESPLGDNGGGGGSGDTGREQDCSIDDL